MEDYTHLACEERDRLAGLRARGLEVNAAARELGRSPSPRSEIGSRELRRNALPSGAWRPDHAEGCYLHRRQRPAVLEKELRLRTYVIDRLSEGWSPEAVAGRLRAMPEKGLRRVCHETIYAFVYRARQKAEKLWKLLPGKRARRRPLRARAARDRIKDKTHISERSAAADNRFEAGHWEGDLIICKRSRPVLVLHERKSRITLMARLPSWPPGHALFKDRMICLLTDHWQDRRRDPPRHGRRHPGRLHAPGAGDERVNHLR